MEKMTYVVLALIGLDVITGVIKAIIKRKLSSTIGVTGLTKHVAIAGIVVMVSFGAKWVGHPEVILPTDIFYILFYGASIVENLKEAGIPLPKWIDRTLYNNRDGERVQ